MIGVEACQKGGSMRSKSVAERSKSDDKADICVPTACAFPAPGALSLVCGAAAQPSRAMKPGLY
jgi:hypothetical protein